MSAPPQKPCSARKKIMDSMFQAIAQPALAIVNPKRQPANSHLVETRRHNHPAKGSMMTSAIRAEVRTQLICSGPIAKPPCISLNELFTIWIFINPRYVAKHITMKAGRCFGAGLCFIFSATCPLSYIKLRRFNRDSIESGPRSKAIKFLCPHLILFGLTTDQSLCVRGLFLGVVLGSRAGVRGPRRFRRRL